MDSGATIRYRLDGREVSHDEFFGSMRDLIRQTIYEKLVARFEGPLATLRCEEHGRTPGITIAQSAPDGIKVTVDACCDALKSRTKTLLRELSEPR
jgi:hypothetical protein